MKYQYIVVEEKIKRPINPIKKQQISLDEIEPIAIIKELYVISLTRLLYRIELTIILSIFFIKLCLEKSVMECQFNYQSNIVR